MTSTPEEFRGLSNTALLELFERVRLGKSAEEKAQADRCRAEIVRLCQPPDGFRIEPGPLWRLPDEYYKEEELVAIRLHSLSPTERLEQYEAAVVYLAMVKNILPDHITKSLRIYRLLMLQAMGEVVAASDEGRLRSLRDRPRCF
jgi:hypothetical protein